MHWCIHVANTYLFFQASDMARIHETKCPNTNRYRTCNISCDGVNECRSNSNSFDIYSVRFKNCRNIYPHTLVRSFGKRKYKPDPNTYLKNFIYDLTENAYLIKLFIADNLKRAQIRRSLQHSSNYACKYCFSKAVRFTVADPNQGEKKKLLKQMQTIENHIRNIQERRGEEEEEEEEEEETRQEEISNLLKIKEGLENTIKNLKKPKSNLVWPSSTMNGEDRTKQKTLDICAKLEENPNLSKDETKGIYGKSYLLELDNFNYVLDIPTEYMHSGCLGVGKKMIELTFNVSSGVQRKRNTKRKLSSPTLFNELMSNVKSPREASRRTRTLDLAVMKAQEYRNIIILYFPIVVECIGPAYKEERKVWLFFAFMIRACTLPTKEFQILDLNHFKKCCEQFY